MKWYEVSDDCGDGTTTQRRFPTQEAAQAWRDKQEQNEYFRCDGDGSPVVEVDTDSKYFFHDDEDD